MQIYFFKKIEISVSTYNIDNGKMNITGLSGRIITWQTCKGLNRLGFQSVAASQLIGWPN